MTTTAPYLAIAEAIRDRITSGDLATGDRVPSTRAITREWGVAMATATKALARLRQEGLVRAVPGIGTVVTDTAPRPVRSPAESLLTRDLIVRTAIALADAEGLAVLSMRRIATALGSSTMALYRHVPGKAELMRSMADAAFAEHPMGALPPGGWRPALEKATRWLRAAYTRHPWLAQAMASFTRPVASPQAMAYTEWTLQALRPTGMTPHQMLHTHLTLFAHVQGVSMAAERETEARQDSGLSGDEWMARNEPHFEAIAAGGAYPLLTSLFEGAEVDLDLDTLFEFGLARLLDGVAAMIGETSA